MFDQSIRSLRKIMGCIAEVRYPAVDLWKLTSWGGKAIRRNVMVKVKAGSTGYLLEGGLKGTLSRIPLREHVSHVVILQSPGI